MTCIGQQRTSKVMIHTLPSIEELGKLFECSPVLGDEHPEYGLLEFEVEYESDYERIGLQVLPLAGEVLVSLVTKNPTRIVRQALGNVSVVRVETEDESCGVCIEFDDQTVSPFHLWIKPTVVLTWGNQEASQDRSPPWERTGD
jgi:hypothetical protein